MDTVCTGKTKLIPKGANRHGGKDRQNQEHHLSANRGIITPIFLEITDDVALPHEVNTPTS